MLAVASMACADIVVIGHTGMKVNKLSAKQIGALYLGKYASVNNQDIQPLGQAEGSAVHQKFYKKILGWSQNKVNSYWAVKVFSGDSNLQPQRVESQADAIDLVAANPGAIAYVDSKVLARSRARHRVKVLYGSMKGLSTGFIQHNRNRGGLISGGNYGLKSSPRSHPISHSPRPIVNKPTHKAVVPQPQQQRPSPLALPANSLSVWQAITAHFKLGDTSGQPLVQQQIHWYLNHRSNLKIILNNSIPYIGYVYQQVKQRHMPAEFALLPFIESGYNPFAYSKVGAAGLWQMMPQTAVLYDLNISWWYDSRRDILTSTKAALNFLQDLHGEFHSWLLAAAGYFDGSGNLHRAMRHSGQSIKNTDFWSLSLSPLTEIYAPKLLAIAHLIQHAKQYGIQLPAVPVRPFFAIVNLKSQLSLDEISKLAGISSNLIRYLNPGMRRYATSNKGGYKLLLPVGRVAQFQRSLSHLKGKTHVSWQYHEVWHGETLAKIAHDYHTSISLLRVANQMPQGDVRQGEGILVPVNLNSKYKNAAVHYLSTTIPELQPTQQQKSKSTPSKSKATQLRSKPATLGVDDLTANDILSGKIAKMQLSENIGDLTDQDIAQHALPQHALPQHALPQHALPQHHVKKHAPCSLFYRVIDYLSAVHL